MTTHTFTLTITTERNMSSGEMFDALDEVITDGQSVARQVADDEEATDRSRLEAECQHSLDIAIAPGNARADAMMRLLVDERDSWLRAIRDLEHVANTYHDTKYIATLSAGLDHAVAMRNYMARLITDLEQLT